MANTAVYTPETRTPNSLQHAVINSAHVYHTYYASKALHITSSAVLKTNITRSQQTLNTASCMVQLV